MTRYLIYVMLAFSFFYCKDSQPVEAKPDYLSLSYAFSKNKVSHENESISEHNKLQYEISLYQKTFYDAIALYKGKKYLDSVQKFEDAMTIHIEPETYYNYGKSLMSIGKFQEAIKAYEISDTLGYENKINLYYNLACAYSLLNETGSSIKYLQMSIQKGFKLFAILEQDSNLAYIRKNTNWKQILLHLNSDKLLTKNPKEFLANQNKKIKLKSNSVSYLPKKNEEDASNIELELFSGIAFYREELTDKYGYLTVIAREGTYKLTKDSIQVELKKGRKETNHPSESIKQELNIQISQSLTFELIYKENLNGFMKNDFVIYGDDELYALDKKKCAYVKDEEDTSDCEDCKKLYEQKGYFCTY